MHRYRRVPPQVGSWGANRTLGGLSKMMNLAETWGVRDKHTNPCEDIERYPERRREGFLRRRNCSVSDRH